MSCDTLTNLGTDYYDISKDEILSYGIGKFIVIYGLINDTTLIQCTGIELDNNRVEITTSHVNREKTTILNEDGNWIHIPLYPRLSDEGLEAFKYLQELNKKAPNS